MGEEQWARKKLIRWIEDNRFSGKLSGIYKNTCKYSFLWKYTLPDLQSPLFLKQNSGNLLALQKQHKFYLLKTLILSGRISYCKFYSLKTSNFEIPMVSQRPYWTQFTKKKGLFPPLLPFGHFFTPNFIYLFVYILGKLQINLQGLFL